MATPSLDVWPFFGIRIVTPTVELRIPSDDELCALADVAVAGIHEEGWMPFSAPWTEAEPDAARRGVVQYGWRSRAELSADDWALNFAVWADGELVGTQGVLAKSFGRLRSVNTGSWIGREFQGRGIGKEMRRAVLHFAFDGLGAVEALTEARHDNAASIGVTRALGYEPNGEAMDSFGDTGALALRFRMTRESWAALRKNDVEVSGVEPCLALLGANAS